MRPTSLCSLWKKVMESPEEQEVLALTQDQQRALGGHLFNACKRCESLVESQFSNEVPEAFRENPSYEGLPLWIRILFQTIKVPTADEQAVRNTLAEVREKAEQEITSAVRSFIAAYPELEPAKFDISDDIQPTVLFLTQQSAVMLAERMCRLFLGGAELEKLELREDGSLLVNGSYEVSRDKVKVEVCNLTEKSAVIAERLLRWLCVAARLHRPLLDPSYNDKFDSQGKKDPFAAWRIQAP